MGKPAPVRPQWEAAFLAAVREGATVTAAARAGGIAKGTAYSLAKTNARFAAAWTKAKKASGKPQRSDSFTRKSQWKKPFLEALAETSNVSASAAGLNIPTQQVYQLRRTDAQFAADWRAALFEGYANLEMEVLGYLRDPDPSRKMDVAAALRLLSAHKDAVAAERATRANVSAAEVRASIDRKVAIFRQQVAAEKARQSA